MRPRLGWEAGLSFSSPVGEMAFPGWGGKGQTLELESGYSGTCRLTPVQQFLSTK